MSSNKYWVNHMSGMSGQPQTRLLCLKSEPLPLMPARHKHTHTHNHPHLSLPVSGQGRQWDNGRVDLGLSITAPVNASTCQRLDGANKPLPSHAHNAFPSPTVLRGWQLILAISLSVMVTPPVWPAVIFFYKFLR